MPKAAFFQRLGVFANENFLEPDLCDSIRSAMLCPQSARPAVITQDGSDRVDEAVRKVKQVEVSDSLKCSIEQRLNDVRPKIEEWFGLQLGTCERPQFLAYQAGDFFTAHIDSSNSPTDLRHVRDRRISVVIFLNGDSSTDPNGYSGGSLILYGLLQQPLWEKRGFNIHSETGLLIAFASDLYHEVTPIVRGMRFTLVTWFPDRASID